MYIVQQSQGLDEGIEDALYDSQAIRQFVGLYLERESAADATTLLRFRHRLEEHHLTETIFVTIKAHLASLCLMLCESTIVDADSGLVHTVIGTAANVNDITQAQALLHGDEKEGFGDAGHHGAEKRPEAQGKVRGNIAMQPGKRQVQDMGKKIDQLCDHSKRSRPAFAPRSSVPSISLRIASD